MSWCERLCADSISAACDPASSRKASLVMSVTVADNYSAHACILCLCVCWLRTLPHVRQYVPLLLNLTARIGPSWPLRQAVSCVGNGSATSSAGTSGGGAGPYFSRIGSQVYQGLAPSLWCSATPCQSDAVTRIRCVPNELDVRALAIQQLRKPVLRIFAVLSNQL